MTMKQRFFYRSLFTTSAVCALSLLASVVHAATCFIVYDRNEQAVYRNFESPVDLSRPIGAQVASRWRGGALVMVGDAERCIPFEIDPNARPAAAIGATEDGKVSSGKSAAAAKAPARTKEKSEKAMPAK